MCKSLMEGKLKSLFEGLAARLAANKASPYFVGDSITIADLQVTLYRPVRSITDTHARGRKSRG